MQSKTGTRTDLAVPLSGHDSGGSCDQARWGRRHGGKNMGGGGGGPDHNVQYWG